MGGNVRTKLDEGQLLRAKGTGMTTEMAASDCTEFDKFLACISGGIRSQVFGRTSSLPSHFRIKLWPPAETSASGETVSFRIALVPVLQKALLARNT
jgi:hypothetical protein